MAMDAVTMNVERAIGYLLRPKTRVEELHSFEHRSLTLRTFFPHPLSIAISGFDTLYQDLHFDPDAVPLFPCA